jgi:hypothetical protein
MPAKGNDVIYHIYQKFLLTVSLPGETVFVFNKGETAYGFG